ncbi:MAG: 5-formyltetrahydrofolate cyclo-ligase, partial [Spirillospora sp.]
MHDIASKTGLRAELLGRRAAMPPEARSAAGRSIRDALLSVPELEMAGTVAAYVSIGTEPDTRGLLFALWKRGTYVLLPRLLPDDDLDWASYEGPDSLVAGAGGRLEPSEPPRGPG